MMRVFLEIIAGPYAGREIQLEAGGMCRVGRAAKADVILADDHKLSPLHFVIACDSETCKLYDMSGEGGTFHNGERGSQALLRNGDNISAGLTSLVVFIEPGVPRTADETEAEAIAPKAPPARLLDILREQQGPLFALIDAARDPLVRQLLSDCEEEFQSLYEGESAEELAEVAPYLVSVPASSPFLATLVHRGWGKSWGLFMASGEEFKHLRKHLRSLLYLQDAQGKMLYFRFYDPRVLRAYLPTCDAEELRAVFGPIERYILEAESAHTALRFGESSGSLQQERLPLVQLNYQQS